MGCDVFKALMCSQKESLTGTSFLVEKANMNTLTDFKLKGVIVVGCQFHYFSADDAALAADAGIIAWFTWCGYKISGSMGDEGFAGNTGKFFLGGSL